MKLQMAAGASAFDEPLRLLCRMAPSLTDIRMTNDDGTVMVRGRSQLIYVYSKNTNKLIAPAL